MENILQQQKTEANNYNPVSYSSRNKFLKKYHISATIFDSYIQTGKIPFHRTGKVIEIEEYSTLAILKKIETENMETARAKSTRQTVVKPKPINLTGDNGIKIRRKKLNA